MIRDDALRAFRDPDRSTVAEWAERELSRADGGSFGLGPVPYCREIVEAYADPGVEEIVVVKQAQAGFTESVILPIVGYHIAVDPRDVLIPLPTADESRKWAKAKLDPFLEKNPELQERLDQGLHRDAMTERDWPGGSLILAGSNSARPFRMVTVAVVLGDDVDGWSRTAGRGDLSEGDQITLARRRTDRVPDRKLVWISTPTRNDARIWRLFHQMERRGEWHVPCPECGELQVLTLRGNLRWEKRPLEDGKAPAPGEIVSGDRVHLPETAWVECGVNGCRIEESSKRWMAERGRYLAEDGAPVRMFGVKRVGYHFHGGLTVLLAGGEWSRLAEEFVILSGGKDLSGIERRSRRERLRSFINTALGETWEMPSGAPEVSSVLGRREDWRLGDVPDAVQLVTAGCDWQRDRAVILVVGWNHNRESWILDHRVLSGPDAPFNPEVRSRVWELLLEGRWRKADGSEFRIEMMGVDAGHWQDSILELALEGPAGRFWPIKGASRPDAPPRKTPSRRTRWPYVTVVNVHQAKHRLYSGLRLSPPAPGEPHPEGYVHLPRDLPASVVRELTAEEFDRSPDARGFPRDQWVNPHQRANEALDCFVYAYRAAEPYFARLPRPGEDDEELDPLDLDREPERSKERRNWLGREKGSWWGDRGRS